MTVKTIKFDFDACFILVILILISGCAGGGDIENNEEIAVTIKINKLSTNVAALRVETEGNVNYRNNNRKNVSQIEIVEIFKQNDINELLKVIDDGFDLISISSVRGKLGVTPLHVASKNGSNEILEYLGGFDVNFNIQDNGGGTLLHAAITGNQVDTVKLLLKMGVNLNLKNKQGYTAMDIYLINKDTIDKEIYSILTNSDDKMSVKLSQ